MTVIASCKSAKLGEGITAKYVVSSSMAVKNMGAWLFPSHSRSWISFAGRGLVS